MECLAVSGVSTLLIGATAVGKTALIRDVLLNQLYNITDEIWIDHVTLSIASQADMLKKQMERRLIYSFDAEDKTLRPLLDKKLIIYIDDLHLPGKDNYG